MQRTVCASWTNPKGNHMNGIWFPSIHLRTAQRRLFDFCETKDDFVVVSSPRSRPSRSWIYSPAGGMNGWVTAEALQRQSVESTDESAKKTKQKKRWRFASTVVWCLRKDVRFGDLNKNNCFLTEPSVEDVIIVAGARKHESSVYPLGSVSTPTVVPHAWSRTRTSIAGQFLYSTNIPPQQCAVPQASQTNHSGGTTWEVEYLAQVHVCLIWFWEIFVCT